MWFHVLVCAAVPLLLTMRFLPSVRERSPSHPSLSGNFTWRAVLAHKTRWRATVHRCLEALPRHLRPTLLAMLLRSTRRWSRSKMC